MCHTRSHLPTTPYPRSRGQEKISLNTRCRYVPKSLNPHHAKKPHRTASRIRAHTQQSSLSPPQRPHMYTTTSELGTSTLHVSLAIRARPVHYIATETLRISSKDSLGRYLVGYHHVVTMFTATKVRLKRKAVVLRSRRSFVSTKRPGKQNSARESGINRQCT
jgi:hypothetical protein